MAGATAGTRVYIEGYKQFGGTHWETGSIRNVLAHQMVATGNGEPLSEAMLVGIAGGISVLYFVFEYEGHEPQVFIGTRYAEPVVDTLETMYKRLGIEANVKETTSREKAVANLVGALREGQPAIVWANVSDLPYNALPDTGFAGAMPIVVYGYDEPAGQVHIADRSSKPLTCTPEELSKGRAAQGNLKNRVLTLQAPPRLQEVQFAVEEGIRACVRVMLEGPGRGPKANFGLAALAKWADMMTDTRDKKSWPYVFATGPSMYTGLVWAFSGIELFGTGGGAARRLYADFLNEASALLGKLALKEVAAMYLESAVRWSALAEALLPGSVPAFKETRDLLLRKAALFKEQGMDALDEMQAIAQRLQALKAEVAKSFPLTEAESAALREGIREQILRVHDAEKQAALALRDALT